MKKWQEKMIAIFENEQEFADYQVMKQAFSEDMTDMYEREMDFKKKSGLKFNISDLDDGKFRELEDQYLKAFQKRYGQKLFKKYLKTKEEFNDANPSMKVDF
jgi:hypothetical protein